MNNALHGISSMATRQVLNDVVADWRHFGGQISFESMGGVDALKRVQSGGNFDVVVLAADAIDKLVETGLIVADSKTDLVRSAVAIAVRSGAPRPSVDTEHSLREAVLSARTVGHSTGPSGVALKRLFNSWQISALTGPRIVQAPPGVPVGVLIARGEVDLGFQQLSELMHLPGIDVIGPMPPGLDILTTFAGGVCSASTRSEAARELLNFIRSPVAHATKWRHGMQPA